MPYFATALTRICLALTLSTLLFSCASNPTGGSNFVLMSGKSEREVGDREHQKLLDSVPIYRDEKLQAYVESIGNKLAAVSHRPDLDYVFTIIDSPEINAFALPGGYVYVNRGLLTFLTSEAQLAAVIGHEIGHITARHAVLRETAKRSSKIISTTAAVVSVFATGTSVLGDTADLFGGALVSGYGRDMELEADELGAEYVYKAGYDPSAIIGVIEVLKSHEDFMKKISNRGSAYHGLFATHPRNDTRLQQAVGKVAELAPQTLADIDPNAFRNNTSGLIVGPSAQNAAGAQGRNRYYQTLLNYTIVFPEEWLWSETPTTVTAKAAEPIDASLGIEVRRLQKQKELRLYVREDLQIEDLQQSEELSQFGLRGITGINPDNGERLAVFYFNQRAFIVTGHSSKTMDAALLESIRSFRPIARNEGVFANPLRVVWVQTNGGLSYEELARRTRIPNYATETLRLMNGDYPAGEPKAEEWIKITN